MKGAIITIAFAALAGALCAQAPVMYAEVPFGFTVGKVSLPAGVYKIDEIRPSIVRLRGAKENSLPVGFTAYAPQDRIQPRLVFTRVGGSYFLRQVWNASPKGVEFPPSAAEKEMLARGNVAEQVVLALALPK